MHEATLPLLNVAILGSFMIFILAEVLRAKADLSTVRSEEDRNSRR